jgi:multidrug resistance efflux pump
VSDIRVRLHSIVQKGDTLFVIDRRKYEYAVRQAEANVDRAAQSVGAGTASVKAATAQLGAARARLDRAQRDWDRTQRVVEENPGALSQADRDRSETSLAQAVEGVATAEANLERSREALGAGGADNADLRLAVAQLESAQLDLAFSTVIAPHDGLIESFYVAPGYFTAAGAPIAMLVTDRDVWVQADLRENNLGNIDIGDPVELSLDVMPGKVIKGSVRSVGFGVSDGRNSNPGDLPSIAPSAGWLREPQRFPVIIALDREEIRGLGRIGGQASVIVYTERNFVLNTIGRLQIRVASLLSYVR